MVGAKRINLFIFVYFVYFVFVGFHFTQGSVLA